MSRSRSGPLELAVRAGIVVGAAGFFGYTLVEPVASGVAAAGGGAIILGIYFGLTPWATVKQAFSAKRWRQIP